MSTVFAAMMLSGLLFWQADPVWIGSFQGQSDIGSDLLPGSGKYDGNSGQYEVTGGGANMWDTHDAFHFVWQMVSRDFRLSSSVRILGTEGDPHRKAGLMIRESLDPDSAYVDVVVHGDGLTSMQYRETKGGQTKEVKAAVTGPERLVLERRGDRFTFWVARGDEELKESGSITLKLPAIAYIGLVVCAHDKTRLETAVFDGVRIIEPPSE